MEQFSLGKFNGVGFRKTASNRKQTTAPIYFDEDWHQTIFEQNRKKSPRDVFNAANTACFNAWRNYQNLYGQKKYVLMHSTIWARTPVLASVANFFSAYPDGYTIFIARRPEDWLASALKQGGLYEDMGVSLREYVAAYEAYQSAQKHHGADRMISLNFEKLVTQPNVVLSQLCSRLGIRYNPAMEMTTINGMPIGANSSHAGKERFAPDPALIGWGAEIRAEVEEVPQFSDACRLYEAFRSSE